MYIVNVPKVGQKRKFKLDINTFFSYLFWKKICEIHKLLEKNRLKIHLNKLIYINIDPPIFDQKWSFFKYQKNFAKIILNLRKKRLHNFEIYKYAKPQDL